MNSAWAVRDIIRIVDGLAAAYVTPAYVWEERDAIRLLSDNSDTLISSETLQACVRCDEMYVRIQVNSTARVVFEAALVKLMSRKTTIAGVVGSYFYAQRCRHHLDISV